MKREDRDSIKRSTERLKAIKALGEKTGKHPIKDIMAAFNPQKGDRR